MPKTYNSLTVANAAAGSAILASDHAKAFENINNYRVPPMARIIRTSDASWTGGTDITFQSATFDTDGMWSAGSPTVLTVQTAGVYQVTAALHITCVATLSWLNALLIFAGAGFRGNGSSAYGATTGFWQGTYIFSATAGQTFSLRPDPFGGSSFVQKGAADYTNANCSLTAVWLGQAS